MPMCQVLQGWQCLLSVSSWLALQAHPGSVALVVAHENITAGTYLGEDADFLAANMLFRSGGAAAVLSSRCVSAIPACHVFLTASSPLSLLSLWLLWRCMAPVGIAAELVLCYTVMEQEEGQGQGTEENK